MVLKNSGNFVASAYLHGLGIAPVLQLVPAAITTFAGNGNWNYVNGAAASASFRNPQGLAIDLAGDIYVADSVNQVIRKIAAGSGTVSTVVGNGLTGYSGDGGPALSATLNSPTGIAFDAAGNLFIADEGNSLIRRVDAVTGVITTVAGGGGSTAVNVPATTFKLYGPTDIALDVSGNLYIADSYNSMIRKVSATTNLITNVAGGGNSAGSDGVGDGGPALSAVLNNPTGITLDASGNLYFSDTGHGRVRRVDASTGTITAVAGDGNYGSTGDGGPAVDASLGSPAGLRLDASGNLYIADAGTHRIRFVSSATGVISTIAGNGDAAYSGDNGIATLAALNNPMDVALNTSGNLFVADYSNDVIRKLTFVPPTLTFPSTNVTLTSADVPVRLNNVGLSSLSLSGLAITAGFQQKPSGATDCTATASVAPGANCQIDLVFAPTVAGAQTGTLTLHSNNGNSSSSQQAVNLAATGLSGYPIATLSPTSLTFATQTVGTTSAAQAATLTNSGTAALSITGIQISGANSSDFSLSANTCQSTLAASSSCSLSITAKPTLAGSRTASLTVTDNGSSSPQNVALNATGVGGAVPTLSPTTLQFGSVVPNSPAPSQVLTLTNSGNASLSIYSVAISAADNSDFSIGTTTCGSSLAPAASCSVTLGFTPSALGVRTANLLFLLSAGGSPLTVALSGTGATVVTSCVISISPASMAYGPAAVTDTLTVSTTSGCAWTASSNVSWITVTSGGSGTGSGTVRLTIAANTTAQPRTGNITVGTQTDVITQTAGGLRFVPMSPCRIVDTRNPTGPFGGPELAGSISRDFPIPSGSCGIPVTAQAYAINLTIVPDGELGLLNVWPTGQPQPTTSITNSDGRVKANAAIVPAGVNGSITVYASDSTHVIMDISGYFVPATSSTALSFYPLAPCRIADTRNPTGPFGQPNLTALQSRAFPILSSSCSIPFNAQAYSLNFTVVPRGPSVGYLSSWPAGEAQPLVSILNDYTGTVVANGAIVQAGTGGAISVFVTDDADLIIDINGYFAPQQTGGLSLYTVTPCRVLDTRFEGTGQPLDGTLTLDLLNLGQCPLPAQAQTFVFNATVVPEPTLGFLALWPAGTAQVAVSTLNAFDGDVTSNLAIVPGGNGSVNAFTSSPSHVILDLFDYFAP